MKPKITTETGSDFPYNRYGLGHGLVTGFSRGDLQLQLFNSLLQLDRVGLLLGRDLPSVVLLCLTVTLALLGGPLTALALALTALVLSLTAFSLRLRGGLQRLGLATSQFPSWLVACGTATVKPIVWSFFKFTLLTCKIALPPSYLSRLAV